MNFFTIPSLAILSRIDVMLEDGRKQQNAVITIHAGKTFKKGYQFDCFEVSTIEGATFFIPLKTIKVMFELGDQLMEQDEKERVK